MFHARFEAIPRYEIVRVYGLVVEQHVKDELPVVTERCKRVTRREAGNLRFYKALHSSTIYVLAVGKSEKKKKKSQMRVLVLRVDHIASSSSVLPLLLLFIFVSG